MKRFVAYSNRNLDEVIAAYKKKTGSDPTVLIARPDFPVIGQSELLIFTEKAAYGVIMASHLLTKEEIEVLKISSAPIAERYLRNYHAKIDSVEINDYEVPNKRGRPTKGGGTCPHCQQEVDNFDNLGWWWGWLHGIEPSYWAELRMYIFRRDKFICQKCKKQFAVGGLQAHHIEPKETGGVDGARNLVTLCVLCHEDSHPIFSDEQE